MNVLLNTMFGSSSSSSSSSRSLSLLQFKHPPRPPLPPPPLVVIVSVPEQVIVLLFAPTKTAVYVVVSDGDTVAVPERFVLDIPPLVQDMLVVYPLFHETVAVLPRETDEGLTVTEHVGFCGVAVTVTAVLHVTLPPGPVNVPE